jgi:hypothetical protein
VTAVPDELDQTPFDAAFHVDPRVVKRNSHCR